MAIVMTKDGQVRPMRIGDLKEVAERDKRIAQLERLNAMLSAQVDREGKVVDAALTFARELRTRSDWWPEEAALEYVVRQYQEELARLAKGGTK